MAEHDTTLERESNTSQLARDRLVWSIKPFGLLAILLWVLTPTTSDRLDLQSHIMLAFLLGALYGLGFYYQELKYYILQRQHSGRNTRNRMPQEYYWGRIAEVRAAREQKD